MKSGAWLNWAAIGTWLVVSLPTIGAIAGGGMSRPLAALWLAAFVLFGAALSVCLWAPASAKARASAPLLLLESICGLVMVYVSRDGTAAATLVIVAAQLPYFMAAGRAWWWVVAQTAAVSAIFWSIGGPLNGLSVSIAFGGFQAFAVATSSLALSERAAREQLSRANADLVAAHELLAESSRQRERLRISRDLHDTLGHHLTALSLQLDVASRLASGSAAQHVQEAHAITRLLLSDVRDVVSQMRETSGIDVAGALRRLAANAGPVQVHVDVPDGFMLDDAEQGHAIVRAVQEIITNAARHADARNVWIEIEAAADGTRLHARDDGRGVEAVAWGHGLIGMRERFEEQRGRVEVSSGAGHGFEVHGFLPKAGRPA